MNNCGLLFLFGCCSCGIIHSRTSSFFFSLLHMWTVPLNGSSMCWRWRHQDCRCSFICHFVLIYCAGQEEQPGLSFPSLECFDVGKRLYRDGRNPGAGLSRWNVLSVSTGSLWPPEGLGKSLTVAERFWQSSRTWGGFWLLKGNDGVPGLYLELWNSS